MNHSNKNLTMSIIDEKSQSNLSCGSNSGYGDRVSDYVAKKIIQTVDINEMMGMPSVRKY